MLSEKQNSGYTILEVIVAVLAVGILAALAFSPHEEVVRLDEPGPELELVSTSESVPIE